MLWDEEPVDECADTARSRCTELDGLQRVLVAQILSPTQVQVQWAEESSDRRQAHPQVETLDHGTGQNCNRIAASRRKVLKLVSSRARKRGWPWRREQLCDIAETCARRIGNMLRAHTQAKIRQKPGAWVHEVIAAQEQLQDDRASNKNGGSMATTSMARKRLTAPSLEAIVSQTLQLASSHDGTRSMALVGALRAHMPTKSGRRNRK